MKAVGIKEILAYLNGNLTLDEALNAAQIRTRQYAKRQVTWFKNQMHTIKSHWNMLTKKNLLATEVNDTEQRKN